MDEREVRILDRIGSYHSKHIGLQQEDKTKQSRSDDRKKRGEENLLLLKCPEG